MKTEIIKLLNNIEVAKDVKIIYACEAGSRAWGFPSPDSDWDIRFIYVRKEDWYLSYNIESKRDVIELPIEGDLDCNGWDLKKAFYLFTRTNGSLLEWLGSPTKYINLSGLCYDMLELANRAANKKALCYHYSHMARGNAREYLRGDMVRLKKYLYVIRPIMAIRYIQKYDKIPPVLFSELMDAIANDDLREGLEELLELKSKTSEIGVGKSIKVLSDYIKYELNDIGDTFSGQGRPDQNEMKAIKEELNVIFRTIVRD